MSARFSPSGVLDGIPYGDDVTLSVRWAGTLGRYCIGLRLPVIGGTSEYLSLLVMLAPASEPLAVAYAYGDEPAFTYTLAVHTDSNGRQGLGARFPWPVRR